MPRRAAFDRPVLPCRWWDGTSGAVVLNCVTNVCNSCLARAFFSVFLCFRFSFLWAFLDRVVGGAGCADIDLLLCADVDGIARGPMALFLALAESVGIKDIDFVGRSEAETH